MLSRVAERIYWMGRHLERAENTARLVNVNTNLLIDLPRQFTPGWKPLADITGNTQIFSELHGDDFSERNVVRFLVTDERNPGSILSSINAARENARTIREVMPREAWECITELSLGAKSELSSSLARSRRLRGLMSLSRNVQQLDGFLSDTMLRDSGYLFLRCGRLLERADMTTRIVDVRSADLIPESAELAPFRSVQWRSVLRSLNGYQNYRIRMQAPVQRLPVLQFLFQDEAFPRSLLFCLTGIRQCLAGLPRNEKPLKLAKKLMGTIRRSKLESLIGPALNAFIDERQVEIAHLNDVISRTYFELEKPRGSKRKRKSKARTAKA
jgi:uncharacterized alpha-E superfamily protein